MNWCGDYPEDFATVCIYFTTHDSNGAPVAPLTAFEADDVKIYKNGSNAQKTSTNGVTMASPFDAIVGLHCIVIDTSNDTGDSGFWTSGGGGVYTVVLNPDTETVNGQTALKVIGTFGICLSGALRQASYVAPDNSSVAAIKAKTDNLPSDPADQSLIVAAIPTADQNADALLDRANAIETGLTPRQAMRLSAAADAGKLSGGATTTNTIRNAVADDKNRIVATVDASGNRTAMVYDLT